MMHNPNQFKLFWDDENERWPNGSEYSKDLYGSRPPAAPVDTSREAMDGEEATRKAAIVLFKVRESRDGYTSDELEQLLGWPHQTVSARLRELEQKHLVYKSSDKRTTRSGRLARV